MIPMVMVVRIEDERVRPIRIWIPLFLIWILLAPLVILLAPIAFVAAVAVRVDAAAAAVAFVRLLGALSDTLVEVESPRSRVFLLLK